MRGGATVVGQGWIGVVAIRRTAGSLAKGVAVLVQARPAIAVTVGVRIGVDAGVDASIRGRGPRPSSAGHEQETDEALASDQTPPLERRALPGAGASRGG